MSLALPDSSVPSLLKPIEGPVWLRTGKLFTGADARVVNDGHLVYDRAGVLYAGSQPPPAEVLRAGCVRPDVDLPDHAVMPGLTDAHTHLFLEGGELDPVKRAEYLKLPPEAYQERAQSRLRRLVALGVTAVREAGDKVGVGTALQARWRSSQRGV
ncbi:MAG TPA: amidohydrolase family protein, partial [Opitutaceae bacterium]|nr:amidohydrolase family protein [Opitutaceae bacterium]